MAFKQNRTLDFVKLFHMKKLGIEKQKPNMNVALNTAQLLSEKSELVINLSSKKQ